MKQKTFYFCIAALTFLLGITLDLILADKPEPVVEIVIPTLPEPAFTANPTKEEVIKKTVLQQDIRLIDFKNFTYNWFPKYGELVIKKKIELHKGENKEVYIEGEDMHPLGEDYQEKLMDVSYADLTGDGKEEAIVTVGVSFYRWTPMCIFIFSEKNKRAVQLWRYETGAHSTFLELRGLKVNDGKIIIEEYDTENTAVCCPTRYFRTVFAWNEKAFAKKNRETIPYEKYGKDFLGYPSINY